jgi:hypothetical protein
LVMSNSRQYEQGGVMVEKSICQRPIIKRRENGN